MRIAVKKISEYPLLARLIFWAQKKKYGQVLLPTQLWARSPILFYGLQTLYRTIDRKRSPLEPELRALLNVKVSQINACTFCIDIGSALLLKRGNFSAKIDAIQEYEASNVFSERERAALAYAEAMTITNRQVSNELFRRICEVFSENEVIELTALIGYQNMTSKFNAALAVPSQGFCQIK